MTCIQAPSRTARQRGLSRLGRCLGLLCCLPLGVAQAQGSDAASLAARPGPALSLGDAEQLAAAARLHCAGLGRPDIAVAVVDGSGQTLLLSRSPAVGPHNLEAARRKAYTALSTRQNTLALGRQARSQPDTAALQYLPELLLLGGGVPLRQPGRAVGAEATLPPPAQGATLGAVGVAGGGGPVNDDACAAAAVQAWASRLPGMAP